MPVDQMPVDQMPVDQIPVDQMPVYCIEGTEMRQLGFKVRRLLFLNRY